MAGCLVLLAVRAAAILLPSASVMAADDSGPGSDAPATDIRKEMLAEYRFSPKGDCPAAAPSTPAPLAAPRPAAAPSADGKDIVVMAPFEVQMASGRDGLQTAAFQDEPTSEGEKVASGLGIGVHRMKLGRVNLYARTILFIPFLVGIEW
jgi:hypothetical protein